MCALTFARRSRVRLCARSSSPLLGASGERRVHKRILELPPAVAPKRGRGGSAPQVSPSARPVAAAPTRAPRSPRPSARPPPPPACRPAGVPTGRREAASGSAHLLVHFLLRPPASATQRPPPARSAQSRRARTTGQPALVAPATPERGALVVLGRPVGGRAAGRPGGRKERRA